jgi:hypothetical protein
MITLGTCDCPCEPSECFVGKTLVVDGYADIGQFNAPSFSTVLAVATSQVIDAIPWGQTKYIKLNSSGAIIEESIGPGFINGCQSRKGPTSTTVQLSVVRVSGGSASSRCCFCDHEQRFDIFGNLISTVCNETVYEFDSATGSYTCDVRVGSRTFDLIPEDPGNGYFARSLAGGVFGDAPTCCFP